HVGPQILVRPIETRGRLLHSNRVGFQVVDGALRHARHRRSDARKDSLVRVVVRVGEGHRRISPGSRGPGHRDSRHCQIHIAYTHIPEEIRETGILANDEGPVELLRDQRGDVDIESNKFPGGGIEVLERWKGDIRCHDQRGLRWRRSPEREVSCPDPYEKQDEAMTIVTTTETPLPRIAADGGAAPPSAMES